MTSLVGDAERVRCALLKGIRVSRFQEQSRSGAEPMHTKITWSRGRDLCCHVKVIMSRLHMRLTGNYLRKGDIYRVVTGGI